MAWMTLIIGGIILLAGLVGQYVFLRHRDPRHPHDRQARRLVVTIGSAVVGLWLVAFSAVQLLHLHHTGHW
ncbi:hypothetical protein [Silvibacterium dinghuense]|uniref:Uncharacterized protein n=1 Tax=Silvibacterium dinghuense TaxID=1560006 RepID=A0A4Q1SER5_9BACT|nr:hypothetical protein [Silvibacterium dinghuense]RXS95428.1 hypothetical protein ESZ00_12685 [Silvibacterium dinghuense]GGH13128.1 hypothetical protein GCM10011586_32820 [Silvibacterium dinghuense]